jgi:hypothetical protein
MRRDCSSNRRAPECRSPEPRLSRYRARCRWGRRSRRRGSARQAGGAGMQRVAQGRVGHHGQRIHGLSRRGHLPHVSGHRPGVEILVRVGTEGSLPVCRWRCNCNDYGALGVGFLTADAIFISWVPLLHGGRGCARCRCSHRAGAPAAAMNQFTRSQTLHDGPVARAWRGAAGKMVRETAVTRV